MTLSGVGHKWRERPASPRAPRALEAWPLLLRCSEKAATVPAVGPAAAAVVVVVLAVVAVVAAVVVVAVVLAAVVVAAADCAAVPPVHAPAMHGSLPVGAQSLPPVLSASPLAGDGSCPACSPPHPPCAALCLPVRSSRRRRPFPLLLVAHSYRRLSTMRKNGCRCGRKESEKMCGKKSI